MRGMTSVIFINKQRTSCFAHKSQHGVSRAHNTDGWLESRSPQTSYCSTTLAFDIP